jgi:hypothetical protein
VYQSCVVARHPKGRWVASVSFASRIEETTPGIMTTGASAWILVETRTRRRRLGKTREGNMVQVKDRVGWKLLDSTITVETLDKLDLLGGHGSNPHLVQLLHVL